MGGVGLIFLVIVAVVAVLGLLALMTGLVPFVRRIGEEAQQLREHPDQALAYDVPVGRDAAAVMAALRAEGFEAVTTEVEGHQRVLVATPEGPDRQRAQVRAVIAHQAKQNMEGDEPPDHTVRFTDE